MMKMYDTESEETIPQNRTYRNNTARRWCSFTSTDKQRYYFVLVLVVSDEQNVSFKE